MSTSLTIDNMESFVECSRGILRFSYPDEITEFLVLISIAQSASDWPTRAQMLLKCQQIGVCDSTVAPFTAAAWESRFEEVRANAQKESLNVGRLSPPTIDLFVQHVDLVENCAHRTLRYRTVNIFTILMVIVLVLMVSTVFVHPNLAKVIKQNIPAKLKQ
jgi:hypothetical protein